MSEASKMEAKQKLIEKLQKQIQLDLDKEEERERRQKEAHAATQAQAPEKPGTSHLGERDVQDIIALVDSGTPSDTMVRKVRREVEITLTLEKALEQERESVRERERQAEELLSERRRLIEKITLEKKLGSPCESLISPLAEERKRSLNMEQSMLDIREAELKLIQDELKLERELAKERCVHYLSSLCSYSLFVFFHSAFLFLGNWPWSVLALLRALTAPPGRRAHLRSRPRRASAPLPSTCVQLRARR